MSAGCPAPRSGDGHHGPAIMEPVVFAGDCPPCPYCGEPWCEKCQAHYAECSCIGPHEDGVEYEWRCDQLMGRRTEEMSE